MNAMLKVRGNGVAERAVLGVLKAGGQLTAEQITRQAQLTSWSARHAIDRLAALGQIVPILHQQRYMLSPMGRATLEQGTS